MKKLKQIVTALVSVNIGWNCNSKCVGSGIYGNSL